MSEEVVPRVGMKFNSWEEAKRLLDANAHKKYFQWTTDSSTSINNENRKLMAQGEQCLYKKELVHKNIVLTCVSGGKKRVNNGRGDRPFQATWKVDCPTKVHLIADKEHLTIRELVVEHNHTCDKEYFDALPQTRRANLSNEKAASTAKLLFQGGVKPSVVRSLLRDLGCGQVTQRDLANLRSKWKKEGRGGRTPEELLSDTLQQLLEADPDAFISIGKTEENELEYLFIQTSAMRKCMQDFGYVVMLDHTYKINRNRMPVTVMMTMDGHGDGRAVGYAFVANEKSSTITQVMESFKQAISDDCAAKIKTFIIDKDYSEVKAIKNVFPSAAIQLCDFHVSRTFKAKTKKENPRVRQIVDNMRFCGDEETFSQLVEELKGVASEKFMEYFTENWLNCEMSWSFRDKKKVANLGNNTNNRLENHNSKIKMMLNSNNELFEAVQNLLKLVQNKEEDVIFRNALECAKESYYLGCTDPLFKRILNDMTKFSARLMIYELRQTVTEAEVEKFHSTAQDCKCPHWCSILLPCRHMFHCRRASDVEVYSLADIHPMWLRGHEAVACEESQSQITNFMCQTVPSKMMPRTGNERFTHSMGLLRQIGSLLSECGDGQYAERYSLLERVFELWASGKETLVVEVIENQGLAGNQLRHSENGNDLSERAQAASNPQPGTSTDMPSQNNVLMGVDSSIEEVSQIEDVVENTDLISLPAVVPALPTPLCTSCEDTDVTITPKRSQPQCRCGLPTIRTVAGPLNRMAGRAFDVCRFFKCGFRRLASKFVTDGNDNNNGECSAGQEDESSCNDDEPECGGDMNVTVEDAPIENIHILADILETVQSWEDDDFINDLHSTTAQPHAALVPSSSLQSENSRGKVTTPTEAVDTFSILNNASPVLVDNSLSIAPAKSAGNENIAQEQINISHAMEGIKLPVSVKHKGRPQGLGKTVSGWMQKTGKNAGASGDRPHPAMMVKPRGAPLISSIPFDWEDSRKQRGLAISDEDVKKCDAEGNSWSVKSQAKNSTETYTISKISESSCKDCSEEFCVHVWRCDCEDHVRRKLTCKHIYKVVTVVQSNNGCPLCKNGDVPSAHHCVKCKIGVHIFCSKSIGDEEGYGELRICLSCDKEANNSANICRPFKKRKVDEDDHNVRTKMKEVQAKSSKQQKVLSSKPSLFLNPPVTSNAGQFMGDEVIVEVTHILRKQFPDVGGLQEPASSNCTVEIAMKHKDTVNIFCDTEREHWLLIVVPQFSTTKRDVFIYDSIQRKPVANGLTNSLERAIAQMCNEEGPGISVSYPACQQQGNTLLCGLFAIAYAVEFCVTRKIRCPFFKVSSLKPHLDACLRKGQFTPFPKDPLLVATPGRRMAKAIIRVCCVCRMPEHVDKTITCSACDEKFHLLCVNVTPNQEKWCCPDCQ